MDEERIDGFDEILRLVVFGTGNKIEEVGESRCR